jgi:peptidyl-tRNA hydrolase
MVDKLYIVTRADLRPGQQAVQAAHAMRQFIADHPDIDRKWFEQSNTLAFLSVPDEKTLRKLVNKADDQDLRFSSFREPDLDNALTALAIEPSPLSRRLCKNLPLALGG